MNRRTPKGESGDESPHSKGFSQRTTGFAKIVGLAGSAEVVQEMGFMSGGVDVSYTLAESAMLQKSGGKGEKADEGKEEESHG
ncbi:MAG: hypothetical protein ACOX1P_24470 [Thermoguttaceae bacterium]|jgi:hypothetical protein